MDPVYDKETFMRHLTENKADAIYHRPRALVLFHKTDLINLIHLSPWTDEILQKTPPTTSITATQCKRFFVTNQSNTAVLKEIILSLPLHFLELTLGTIYREKALYKGDGLFFHHFLYAYVEQERDEKRRVWRFQTPMFADNENFVASWKTLRVNALSYCHLLLEVI